MLRVRVRYCTDILQEFFGRFKVSSFFDVVFTQTQVVFCAWSLAASC